MKMRLLLVQGSSSKLSAVFEHVPTACLSSSFFLH